MEPMFLSIQQEATGKRIKDLLKQRGYSVKEIQQVMGFENPQAVYKWLSGKSLPSVDNLLILSKVLHTSIEDILVIDGDVLFLFDVRQIKRYYLRSKNSKHARRKFMFFVPDGTQVCGFYECRECGMRYLSQVIAPVMVCPYCGKEVDMEIGPDDEMPEAMETAKLLKVIEGEEVEKMDGLLSLAITGGDCDWL